MGLGIGGKLGVIFLGIINLVFVLLAIGIIVIGGVMKADKKVPEKDEIITVLNQIPLNNSLKLGSVANSLPVLLICIGCFIFAIAALGLIGACMRNKWILLFYGIAVALIFIVQMVGVVFWFTMRDKTEATVKAILRDAMNTYYEGPRSYNPQYRGPDIELSRGWDLIFIGYECCGIDAVGPWNIEEFKDTVWGRSPNRGIFKIPYSCCVYATVEDLDRGMTNLACMTVFTGYKSKGCYEAFKESLDKYVVPAVVIGLLLLITEIICVIAALVLCRTYSVKEPSVKPPSYPYRY